MKSILFILFRRRRELSIFALSIILMPLAISYMVTEKYNSEASILLTAGRFKKPFLPNEANSRTGFVQISIQDVASEVEILLSNPVLEKVVQDNNLYIFPEPGENEYLKRAFAAFKKSINYVLVAINLKKEMTDFEVALGKLKNDVDVDYLKRTNIISIEWQGYSPDQARNVVTSLVKEYIKHHIKVHGNFKAFAVTEHQMQSDHQRVMEMEGEINRIKSEMGSYDLNKERAILMDKYLEAKSMYENLLNINPDNVMSTSRGLYAEDPNFVKLIEELTRVEMERIEKIVSFGSKNRQVSISNKQIKRLQLLINREHKHNLEAWHISVERYKTRLEALEQIRKRIRVLERKLAGLLGAYQISQQKYNEALIARSMDQAGIASAHIVSPASFSSTPSYPKKMSLLLVSIFFAIFGGVAAAFAAEKMHSRVIDNSDITDFCKLPVLFTIAKFSTTEFKDSRFVLNALSKKFAAVGPFLASDSQKVTVHLVVSPSPGAGTSFLTGHLARYAQQTTKTKSLYINVDYDPNMREEGSDPTIQAGEGMDELKVIVPSPQDHPSYDSLLNKIKEQNSYGNIFIDFMPNERDDYSYLYVIPSCDHIFVNTAYDITDKFALRRLVSVIADQLDVVPAGAFLNLRKNEIPDFIYKRL